MAPDELSVFFFVIFGALLLLIVMLKLTQPGYISELYSALWNPNLTQHLQEEGKLGLKFFQLPADILFVSGISFFGMLWLDTYTLNGFLNLFLLTGSFYFLQIVAVKVFSRLFFGSNTRGGHESEMINFNRSLGVIMVPLMFIAFYATIPYPGVVLEIFKWFLITFAAVRFIRIMLTLRSEMHHGAFYIFLYLCALEISPTFLFIRAILLP